MAKTKPRNETSKKTHSKKAPAAKATKAGASARRSAEPADVITAARAEAYAEASPEAAFRHFRGLAAAVSTEDLPVFTGQPLLMRANVLAALEAVEPHLETAVRALREP